MLKVKYSAWVLHCSHVVLWKKWDFQDFGVGKYCFMAGGRNGLPGDSVNLVESMGSQQAVVCGPNEQLERERLAFQVTVQLAREQKMPTEQQHITARNQLNFYNQGNLIQGENS